MKSLVKQMSDQYDLCDNFPPAGKIYPCCIMHNEKQRMISRLMRQLLFAHSEAKFGLR